MFFLFFFYCSANPPDLPVPTHSFPTRRSSDLQRHVGALRLPILERQFDTDMARDRVEVDRRVGRPADRRIDADRVQKGGARQYVARLAVGVDHLDNLHSRSIGAFLPVAMRRGNRRRSDRKSTTLNSSH